MTQALDPRVAAPVRGAVLLTRPSRRADALADRLRAAAIAVHVVPTVETEPIETGIATAVHILRRMGPAAIDWLVVTSPLGASIAIDALARAELRPGRGRPRVAAVGPATAAVLHDGGWSAAVVPPAAGGAAIAVAMAARERLAGRRILLARADAAGSDLPDALRAAGALVEDVAVYRTLEAPTASAPALRDALRDGTLGAIVAASGSAVRGLVRLAGADLAARLRDLPIVSIGPTTSAAVRAVGLHVAAEAARPDDDALFQLIDALLPTTARSRHA